MSYTQQNSDKVAADDSRRTIFIVVGVVTLLILCGIIYLMSRPDTGGAAAGEQRLEGGLRAGSPDFDKYKALLRTDEPDATEGTRAIGDIVMTLHTTARNFTGRIINGLEVRAAVVDLSGKPIKERTVVIVPNRATGMTELQPNKTLPVFITLEGFSKSDVRANIKMEVTALKFK